jgi:hypothetical protein
MEPETVIAEVQADAAIDAVSGVTAQVAEGTVIVASEVDAVSAQLAEHSEVSEERHEEILEGQSWLENQFQSQTVILTSIQSALLSAQTSAAAQSQALLSMLEAMSLKLSTDSSPLNPTLEPEAVVIVEPELVPESEGAENPAPKTSTKRRRLI